MRKENERGKSLAGAKANAGCSRYAQIDKSFACIKKPDVPNFTNGILKSREIQALVKSGGNCHQRVPYCLALLDVWRGGFEAF